MWPYDSLIENVYLKIYRTKNGEDAEKCLMALITGRVSQMAFLSAYKKLPPIETLSDFDKKELKTYINTLMPGKSVEEKLVGCKILYTIGSLI